MRLPSFEYSAPVSVKEVCRILSQRSENSLIMAGGTDLLRKMSSSVLKADLVIGLRKIKGLDRIHFDRKEGLSIGATALLADVASHPDIKTNYPALACSALETANTQIRNMATVAGNICNASPSAENAPPLMAMNGEVLLVSSSGERKIPLEDFFKGPGVTVMRRDELLTEISLPTPPEGSGSSYKHISARGRVDISAVGVGVMLVMDGPICSEVRIVLGAVAPTPMRALEAEKVLRGMETTPFLIEKASETASEESRPISDIRASEQYRKRMVGVLCKRALLEAKDRAQIDQH